MTYYFLGVSQGSLRVPLRPLLLFLLLLSQLFFTLPAASCTKRWDFKQNTYPDNDITFRRGLYLRYHFIQGKASKVQSLRHTVPAPPLTVLDLLHHLQAVFRDALEVLQ